jgi:hypothetical protein
MTKLLFILKRREDYNPVKHSPLGLSTGLFNSASFVVEMLATSGIEAAMEVAIDNNCIDRLINKHKPTHVIIEALWVVPTKFAVLTKLHPDVQWIIRLHSEMPFLAGEGMAMDWLGEYINFPTIDIGINTPRMLSEIQTYLGVKKGWTDQQIEQRIYYLPNHYPQDYVKKSFDRNKYWIDVGCYGAVRPLKNHMLQAVAALKFAKQVNKQLRFHINSGRIEMKGDPVMHNLRGFFQQLSDVGHQLIGHEWCPREEFLQVCSEMDMGLQCNFSETFNIVTADLISQGVPIVGSREIPWSCDLFNADAASSDDIAEKMLRTYRFAELNVWRNQHNLTKYTDKTQTIWETRFKE